MTLANNYAPINQIADGTTVVFSGPWKMISAAYARVYLEDTTTGVRTLIMQGGAADQYQITLSSSGFIVTFNTAPVVGNNVLILRSTTQDQTDPYSTARGFQGGVEEDSFDKLTAIAQENAEVVERSISVPVGDTATILELPIATLRSGKILGFDAFGNVVAVAGSSGGTIISAPMIPVVQAVSVGAALAIMGGAPLASPALTGNPTAPTQTGTDNSTKLATTAFVKANALKVASNLSDLGNLATALANLGFVTSAGTDGYVKLPGGIIVQWGSGTISGGVASAISFPITFPNAVFSVNTTANSNNAGNAFTAMGYGISTAGFTLAVYTVSNTPTLSNVPFSWIAIGN